MRRSLAILSTVLALALGVAAQGKKPNDISQKIQGAVILINGADCSTSHPCPVTPMGNIGVEFYLDGGTDGTGVRSDTHAIKDWNAAKAKAFEGIVTNGNHVDLSCAEVNAAAVASEKTESWHIIRTDKDGQFVENLAFCDTESCDVYGDLLIVAHAKWTGTPHRQYLWAARIKVEKGKETKGVLLNDPTVCEL